MPADDVLSLSKMRERAARRRRRLICRHATIAIAMQDISMPHASMRELIDGRIAF